MAIYTEISTLPCRNAALGTARNNSPRAIAGKLHRHLVAGLTDGEDDGDVLW